MLQVECHCGSLNQGDTFVLDDGPNIYVWVGPKSEKKEQLGVSMNDVIRNKRATGFLITINYICSWLERKR